jgi:hypothetical protein
MARKRPDLTWTREQGRLRNEALKELRQANARIKALVWYLDENGLSWDNKTNRQTPLWATHLGALQISNALLETAARYETAGRMVQRLAYLAPDRRQE